MMNLYECEPGIFITLLVSWTRGQSVTFEQRRSEIRTMFHRLLYPQSNPIIRVHIQDNLTRRVMQLVHNNNYGISRVCPLDPTYIFLEIPVIIQLL